MTTIVFRQYRDADRQACTGLFDANCPQYFAPNERQAYEAFLEHVSADYEVCEFNRKVIGAFGLSDAGRNTKRLNWILIDPRMQGIGIGSRIMERVILLGQESRAKAIRIAASQKSAPFFARFGASTLSSSRNGWGPGLDRIDMELEIESPQTRIDQTSAADT